MPAVSDLLAAGRLQEAEWLMRRGESSPVNLHQLAQRLGTRLDPEPFFVSPGYYAPLSSWSEAAFVCGQAYQSDSVVESYGKRASHDLVQQGGKQPNNPYAIRQLAALQHAWLALDRPGSLRVLDFGGALGSHFHALAPYFPWASLHWIVCETAAVAAVGQAEYELKMPKGHQLRFTANADDVLAQGVDIVMASCSLQYVEHWLSMLEMFRLSPWLLLDRVPLVDHHTDLVGVQVVPSSYFDARLPLVFCSSSKWFAALNSLGFQIVLDWRTSEDSWQILELSIGRHRWSSNCNFGFLLKSKQAATSCVVF